MSPVRRSHPSPSSGQQLFDWSRPAAPVREPSEIPEQSAFLEDAGVAENVSDAAAVLTSKSELAADASIACDGSVYEPTHPWHYYHEGDNAQPIPFDQIEPSNEYVRCTKHDLPKSTAKRIIKARQLLEFDRRELEQAKAHYEDVISRGAEALSRYDREIAYGGNDDIARASTIALLYRQIAWRLGRIAYLERISFAVGRGR